MSSRRLLAVLLGSAIIVAVLAAFGASLWVAAAFVLAVASGVMYVGVVDDIEPRGPHRGR